MKRVFLLVAAAVLSLVVTSCSKYRYEEVADDPLHSRIYTLDNGLKVYMTVNGEAPRIQTYIAVRVGSKNDPLETTGLAHYFEHLMFKGTKSFGTQDYEAERPMLDEIERLFEVYRTTTDADERRAIYARIDSVSQEASKLAIPNEYDKLMSAIGAAGTNAFTSYDMTVYTEEIPSNQIDNWAKIQSDRFANAVIRGFHTELETVYEEYNMSLTSDSRKMLDSLMVALYPHHPYGMHTVLGTQEDLKNPSITNIKNYYKTYYVPNNMAICLSGDFDPDRMIATIDKYFGGLKPNPELPEAGGVKLAENEKEVLLLELFPMVAKTYLTGVKVKAYEAKKAAEAPKAETKAEEAPVGQPITGNTVNAPLPGRILEIKVKVGDSVKAGQEIAVLEAMKMENSIVSDYAGTVKQILVKTGDNVQTDAALIEVE